MIRSVRSRFGLYVHRRSTKVPGLPAKTTYLKDLRILKGNMSLSKDGYDTPAVARSISVLRKKYPLAYAVFQEELRGLG